MYVIIVIVLVYLGKQTYWLVNEGGNVIIYVCNSSNLDNVIIDIVIDDETVLTNSHSNKKLFDYKRVAIFKSFGKHEIKAVVQNKGIRTSEEFSVIGIKWLSVEFVNDEENPSEFEIQLIVESVPIDFE